MKCSQEHKLSEESIQKLPHGVLTGEAMNLHSLMARRAVVTDCEMTCELCNSDSSSSAKSYCHHCSKYLCSFCEEAHVRLKPYAAHTVLKLNSIPGRSSLEQTSTPITLICSDHNKKVETYCFDCDKLICRNCMSRGHRGHRSELLSKVSETIHKDLRMRHESLEKSYSLLEERRSRIEDEVQHIQQDGLDATNFVNQAFDVVLHHFEKYRTNLLQSIRNEIDSDVRELQAKKRSVETAQRQVQPLISLIQQNMQNASAEELACNHKKIYEQVSENQKLCNEKMESENLQPKSFVIYKTSCTRIIGAIGDSLRCADPIMCSLEGQGASRSEVDQETKFNLKVHQSNESPCTAIQNVQVELNSIDKCTTCETHINTVKGSIYEVSYTPQEQGQHILKVRVNERPILGNPFHILVKRPLLDVKEPILIIRGVKKLHDLAVHRSGNLIATQYETGNVISIDKKGRGMKTLLKGIGRPFGIATDKHGWIFLSQNKKSCLQKYSKNMELVNTAGCRERSLGNFNGPGRMALNKKGEIFICDVKNSRVQVFDDDLEYLSWYSISKPTGVTVDGEGDVYITESSKNTLCKVYVTSKMGIAVVRGDLANPQGVYADDDYIYVTEKDAGRVSVLDHDGEFVTALGSGVLKEPGGIVGDEDGYLYVCDDELEAVCVF